MKSVYSHSIISMEMETDGTLEITPPKRENSKEGEHFSEIRGLMGQRLGILASISEYTTNEILQKSFFTLSSLAHFFFGFTFLVPFLYSSLLFQTRLSLSLSLIRATYCVYCNVCL